MSESKENKPPIKVGDFLKKARQKKKIELKTISQQTKISLTMLELLEDNQLDRLPNKTYVTGYIKSYSKALKIDPSQYLDILAKHYGKHDHEQPLFSNESNEHISHKKIPIQYIQFVVILLIPSLYFTYVQIQKSISTDIPPPQAIIEPRERTPAQSPTPQVLSSSTPLLETRESVSPPPPSTLDTPEPKEPLPINDIILKPIRADLYSIESNDTDSLEIIPDNYKNIAEDGQQNIFIAATEGETWLTYQKDGEPIRQFFLEHGQHLFIQGREVLLFLGRVDAVKVFLNNQLLRLDSPSTVKTLIFPQENKTQYYFPLFIYNDDGTVLNSKEYKKLLEESLGT